MAEKPPSTDNSTPFTKLESSEARNSATVAISSGRPIFPRGIRDSNSWIVSLSICSCIGVAIGPGLSGPELVRRALPDDGSILTSKAIRKANSGEGLNLVAWSGIVRPPRPEEDDTLGLELIRGFFSEHAGYRAKKFITQPSDCEWSRRTLNTGAFLWQAAESCDHDERSQPLETLFEKPFLLGATRELASGKGAVLGTWLSSLFSYGPPRIYLRPAEQRLLVAALRGLTDEQLGYELGISLSAVKKTWRSAYHRASQASLPELPLSATGGAEIKRGREKKQPLLEYLRRPHGRAAAGPAPGRAVRLAGGKIRNGPSVTDSAKSQRRPRTSYFTTFL